MNKIFYHNLDNDLNWSENEFTVVLSDHLELLDILGFLANTMFEKKIQAEPYKYYSESFAFKYLYQSFNLNSLLKGTKFTSRIFNLDHSIFDLSSTYLMQRSLLENYLTFFYLFVQPKSEDESRCKWLIYQIAGLNSRQDFKTEYFNYKPKIEKEKNDIENYTLELKNNTYFNTLPLGKQKDVLNNRRAKLLGWEKLFESSKLKSDLFVKAWRLYSNYAHSEYISIIQFKEYRQDDPEYISAKYSESLLALCLTSVFIMDMKNLFTDIDDNFKKLSTEQIECIRIFNGVARESS